MILGGEKDTTALCPGKALCWMDLTLTFTYSPIAKTVCVHSFIHSMNIFPVPPGTAPGAEGTAVTEERPGKWLTSGSMIWNPSVQPGQTFVITRSGGKNTGWCLWSIGCSEETQMPGVPCWPCSPVCAFISHGREGDKTQDLGLQWLGSPRQALLQGACRGWQRVLALLHSQNCLFLGSRVVQAWAPGWEQLSAAPT